MDRPELESEADATARDVTEAQRKFVEEELVMDLVGPLPFSKEKYDAAMKYVTAGRDYMDKLEVYLNAVAKYKGIEV